MNIFRVRLLTGLWPSAPGLQTCSLWRPCGSPAIHMSGASGRSILCFKRQVRIAPGLRDVRMVRPHLISYLHRPTDGWMAGWLDGWIDGWMDGWMLHTHTYIYVWCVCVLYVFIYTHYFIHHHSPPKKQLWMAEQTNHGLPPVSSTANHRGSPGFFHLDQLRK